MRLWSGVGAAVDDLDAGLDRIGAAEAPCDIWENLIPAGAKRHGYRLTGTNG
jgi:hypothetical protein